MIHHREPSDLLSILTATLAAACLLAMVTVAVVTQNLAAAVCFLGFAVLLAPVVRGMVAR